VHRSDHYVAFKSSHSTSASVATALIQSTPSTNIMPRRLPWASKGAGSRKQVQPSKARQPTKPRAALGSDDGFFDGTVLGSNSKGKGSPEHSDDDLPRLLAELSTPRTNTRIKDAFQNKRAQSSSPPPIDDLEQPRVEGMYKGISKFDLRDDEYMMVEDEFLETAKLFTRHLHIAEYERLKEIIENKKKEAEVARPVVANAKRSDEGAMREKAKVQEQKQKKAIREVFATQNNNEGGDPFSTRMPSSKAASRFTKTIKATTESFKPPSASLAQSSDSDDLDAPRPLSTSMPKAAATATPTPTRTPAEEQKSALLPVPSTKGSISTFAKPPLPASKPRSRTSRATPFDMLEEFAPIKSTSTPAHALNGHDDSTPHSSKQSPRASSPFNPSARASTTTASTARRSVDLFDDTPSSNGYGASKETASRLEKRKAEREKDEKERKRKALSLDDIPTFLF
jgi:hypothetical protein